MFCSLCVSLVVLLQGADVSSSIAKATTSGGLHQASWREQGQAPPINELITVSISLDLDYFSLLR